MPGYAHCAVQTKKQRLDRLLQNEARSHFFADEQAASLPFTLPINIFSRISPISQPRSNTDWHCLLVRQGNWTPSLSDNEKHVGPACSWPSTWKTSGPLEIKDERINFLSCFDKINNSFCITVCDTAWENQVFLLCCCWENQAFLLCCCWENQVFLHFCC